MPIIELEIYCIEVKPLLLSKICCKTSRAATTTSGVRSERRMEAFLRVKGSHHAKLVAKSPDLISGAL